MKFLKRPRTQWLLLCIVGVALGGFAWLMWHSRFQIPTYYGSRIAALQNGVERTMALIKTSSDNPRIDEYNHQLAQLSQTCSELATKTDDLANTKTIGPYSEAIGQVKKLCQDLISVADYSQAIYQSSRDYLLLDTAFLDATTNAGFSARAQAVLNTITLTKQTLQKVNYPQVNDPAQTELVKLLERDEKQAQILVDSKTDEQISSNASQLKTILAQDKSNLLNARIYYWTNTVQVAKLEQVLSRLKALFK